MAEEKPGSDDDDIYDDEELEEELDDDEISPDEEGFMKGYEKDYKEGSDQEEEDDIDEFE